MPYWFEAQRKKLPQGQDTRVKLTDEEREHILVLYKRDKLPIRQIARMYQGKCSRKLIQYIIFPERLVIANAQFKERRKDGRYYDRAKQTIAIRKTRQKKARLLKPIT